MFSIDGFLKYCMALMFLRLFSFVWAMAGHELRMLFGINWGMRKSNWAVLWGGAI